MIALVKGFEDFGGELSPHLLYLVLIGTVLVLLVLQIIVEPLKFGLKRLHLAFLVVELGLKFLLFSRLVKLGLPELLLESLQISLGVKGSIRVHICLLRVSLHLTSLLLLLFFDQKSHLPAFILQNHQLLMLSFHGLFVFPLLELKLSELFLCSSELVAQLSNLLVVVSVLV